MSSQGYVSNELTHFVGRHEASNENRYRLLILILQEGFLRASKLKSSSLFNLTLKGDSNKPLSSNLAVTASILCFCDIPPTEFEIHMRKYSRFGISFSKTHLVGCGAAPVHYVPAEAASTTLDPLPSTLIAQLEGLRTELREIGAELNRYVTGLEGRQTFHFRRSLPDTPQGHQIMGRYGWAESEVDRLIFARLKVFNSMLADDDPDNYYMEREWRMFTTLGFRLGDVTRVTLPHAFEERFRRDVPDYTGIIHSVLDTAGA